MNRIDLRFVKVEKTVRPFYKDGKLIGFSFRKGGSDYYAKKWFNEDAWEYLVAKVTKEKSE